MSQTASSFSMPPNACNSHLHIIDPAFLSPGKAVSRSATVEDYRRLAKQLQIPRAVFVQAKPFGMDNTCLLDAIERLGADRARGVAVVDQTVSDAQLEHLDKGGVRGVRFSVWNPQNAVVSFADCYPLSQRIKHLGWHVQLHMGAAQLLQYADIIRRLDCQVVIDHMGRLDPVLGIQDPAYAFLQEMIDRGNTWVKLSGPYLNTKTGAPWSDATRTAIKIAQYAPQRVVWGSDFPHVTEKEAMDESVLVQLIPLWLPTQQAQKLALTDNPQELYGFPANG